MRGGRSEEKHGHKGHFSWSVHAGTVLWLATSAKVAIVLLHSSDGGKNVGANLKVLSQGAPFVKVVNS
jgi:CubicO group peptidase (beta-lactamase class C family)